MNPKLRVYMISTVDEVIEHYGLSPKQITIVKQRVEMDINSSPYCPNKPYFSAHRHCAAIQRETTEQDDKS